MTTPTAATYPSLGILGVGHLASYTVQGLRHAGDTRDIMLSPRGAAQSAKLAKAFNCKIASNNQEVIDHSDMILLAVRPFQADALLAECDFASASDKVVISAMAGIDMDELRAKAELPEQLALMLPTVAAENAQGFVPVHPPIKPALDLANNLGKAIAFDDESQFDLAATHAVLHGWLYRFFAEQISWLEQQGLDPKLARDMVLHNILGAAHYALGRPAQSTQDLCDEIARDGTYTKLGIDQLEADGAFAKWHEALDLVKNKLG